MNGAPRRLGWPARAGSMGRPYPGHRVAVIDDDGNECPRGTPGDVAVHRRDVHGDPDPVFFLGYWKQRRRHARQVHRRPERHVVPHRRHRDDGRRRLPLVPGPQRRRVQGRRLPHRPERDRELPGQAPGGGQRRGGAQARRRARRAGQGLRRAGAPAHAATRRSSIERAAGARARQARALRVPEGDRVHRCAADDDHRQGAAPRAAPARGRRAGNDAPTLPTGRCPPRGLLQRTGRAGSAQTPWF